MQTQTDCNQQAGTDSECQRNRQGLVRSLDRVEGLVPDDAIRQQATDEEDRQ